MSIETNKAIVRRYVEQVLNNQRHDLIDEFLAQTVEFHGPTGSFIGLSEVTKWLTMFAAALPDWHSNIDDMIAEGDKVIIQMTSNGTHQGELEGIPATGKTLTQYSFILYRLTNGKIVEGRVQTDILSMMQQLGLMPIPQAA